MAFTVLIADDEPHIRRVAEFAIKSIGCTVVLAADGQQAWELIKAEPPDILISDVQMPNIDGVELVRRVRTTPGLEGLPIIMLTAKQFELHDSDLPFVESCELMGKPFSPSALAKLAYDLLAKISTSVAVPG